MKECISCSIHGNEYAFTDGANRWYIFAATEFKKLEIKDKFITSVLAYLIKRNNQINATFSDLLSANFCIVGLHEKVLDRWFRIVASSDKVSSHNSISIRTASNTTAIQGKRIFVIKWLSNTFSSSNSRYGNGWIRWHDQTQQKQVSNSQNKTATGGRSKSQILQRVEA